ncbi:MAG TPA: cytochrome c oxidase assembly protein [Jatrophihabitans sp.]|uniref:cytochrome c oxidase assembly protein n=1 Tax=Jatrophihabitans sp. TaxID=1932789 RepID=UPI002DF97810|nr:cytochrome c oxidase assembly protein [Jatrophihabitans sp.]
MTLALDRPSPAAVFSQWTPQPVAIVVALLLAVSYARGVRRLGRPWPRGRMIVFGLGLAAMIWTTCGFFQVYSRSLYWVWTAQTLVLWLAVPIIVLWGRPVQLARAVAGPHSRLEAVLRTRAVRIVSNPLVGPALVPLLSGVLFFGPLPRWAISSAPAGWLLHLVLLVVGALMVLPLVGLDEEASSLAVGFSLAIGSFELVLDALPGVVLRLKNNLATSWFDVRSIHDWTPAAIHDQRVAGAILWCVAELIDLPFLFLVYRRWLRADARDAAQVDAVLEAERAARRGARPESEAEPTDVSETERDTPWWLSDPAMQRRMQRPE